MKRLLLSCEKCRRNTWVDFEGDERALEPLTRHAQELHLVEDFCSGTLLTAVVDRIQPQLRLQPERVEVGITVSGEIIYADGRLVRSATSPLRCRCPDGVHGHG